MNAYKEDEKDVVVPDRTTWRERREIEGIYVPSLL